MDRITPRITAAKCGLLADLKRFEAEFLAMRDKLRVAHDIDQRALSIAVTNGEAAFMWARKAIVGDVDMLSPCEHQVEGCEL